MHNVLNSDTLKSKSLAFSNCFASSCAFRISDVFLFGSVKSSAKVRGRFLTVPTKTPEWGLYFTLQYSPVGRLQRMGPLQVPCLTKSAI